MRVSIRFLAFLLFLLLPLLSMARTVDVKSPSGNIRFFLNDEKAAPFYSVTFDGKPIIGQSALGLAFKAGHPFSRGFKIVGAKAETSDSTWELPWGERRYVRDHYNGLSVAFRPSEALIKSTKGRLTEDNQFILRVRVFNDGLGFRYEVPRQRKLKSVEIIDELTEFNTLNGQETTAWWIPGRKWNRYEYLYHTGGLQEVDRAHTPFTYKTDRGVHVSIHEAALVNYAGMVLDHQRPGILKADLTPWSDGVRVKTQTPFKTPWRTIQISQQATGLLNSNLILNLNEPNKLGDVSWVEPGKYVGIWWGMHIGENTWGSGEKHGATTPEALRYIDFAAKQGFSGVLVEGWNVGWDGDWYANGDVFSFTESYPDFDLSAISTYADKKNVALIGHHETSGSVTNYRHQIDDAMKLYQKHGVKLVKTGYVADAGKIKRVDEKGVPRFEWHDGQFMVGEYLHSVEVAAKYGISINSHEPVKDTGLRRTYPNWVSREGARGQEFNAWGEPPNSPEHTAILPYTRMLSGPMDFTPGIFDLMPKGEKAKSRIQTTLAKQLALYVVLYSPIQMAADLPRNYLAKPEAFQFIKDVPVDWEVSRAIWGEVGDSVAFVRKERGGEDWYLGALTDEKPREFSASLDFLEQGSYIAEIYRDHKNAHWESNPYALVVEKFRVTPTEKLSIDLAAGGGVAVRFRRE